MQLLNKDVLPTFEVEKASIDAVLSDNGREFCGREDRHPYELFLQLDGIVSPFMPHRWCAHLVLYSVR